MTLVEVAKLMTILAGEYGNLFQTSAERARVWFTIIGHASYEEAILALTSLMRVDLPRPPSVGAINQEIHRQRCELAKQDTVARKQVLEEAESKTPAEAAEQRERNMKILNDCIRKLEAKRRVA